MIRLKKLELFTQIMLLLLSIVSIIANAEALLLCILMLAVMAGSTLIHYFGNSIFRQSPRRKLFIIIAAFLYLFMIFLSSFSLINSYLIVFHWITMGFALWYTAISYNELKALLFRSSVHTKR